MRVCAIVGAGDFYSERFEIEKYDFIIAADGGALSLGKIGIRPNLIVGDLDSLNFAPTGVEIRRFKVEKDETDMHLALIEGAKRGYDTFYIFGGVGGRIDHTFANYCLLKYAKEQGFSVYLMDKDYYSFVIKNESASIFGKEGRTFSAFAFGGEARGVSINGAKYEARDIIMTPDFPLGVSNSFISEKAELSVKDGALLVMAEYA